MTTAPTISGRATVRDDYLVDEVDRAGVFTIRHHLRLTGLDCFFVHLATLENDEHEAELPGITPETALVTVGAHGEIVTVKYADDAPIRARRAAAGEPTEFDFKITTEAFGPVLVKVIKSIRRTGEFAALREATA